MHGDYGHNMIAFRADTNRALRGLGDVQSDMLDYGFNSAQISQVLAAYASGALSASGYNQITSGNVDPNNLSDFMAADPGAGPAGTGTSSGSKVPTPYAGSPTAAPNLTPGPAPRVAIPTSSFGTFFTGSTMISGIPNWLVLAGGLMLPLLLLGGSSGSRRR